MNAQPKHTLKAFLFDKDGTLFDYEATWGQWADDVIRDYAAGDELRADELARVLGFDRELGQFYPHSHVIAESNDVVAQMVAGVMTSRTVTEIELDLSIRAAKAPVVSPVDLPSFLADLFERQFSLGVMTNDSEHSARAQLASVNAADYFKFIAGYDSGFGAKPAPDPLLAFARHCQLEPHQIAMVGDSTHDLIAGRAAGMYTIGVLSGPAEEAELAPYADAILPHIGHLTGWLAA